VPFMSNFTGLRRYEDSLYLEGETHVHLEGQAHRGLVTPEGQLFVGVLPAGSGAREMSVYPSPLLSEWSVPLPDGPLALPVTAVGIVIWEGRPAFVWVEELTEVKQEGQPLRDDSRDFGVEG
jgi:hypothetical protein